LDHANDNRRKRRHSAAIAVAAAAVAAALLYGLADAFTGDDDRQPPAPAAARPCPRPYSADSPWNRPIAADEAQRAVPVAIGHPGERLSSDPTQYTTPVYEVSRRTPRVRVHVSETYSQVSNKNRRLRFVERPVVTIRLPRHAQPARGSDAHIVVVERDTGDEWGAWQLRRAGGQWRATNAYHYNIHWSAVPPRSRAGHPFASRGAGVPYLAGLVRPCEIEHGAIRHALAFAYDSPSDRHVYPATKSDGHGSGAGAVPEGTRLQLDPALSSADLDQMGCVEACVTIAQALQEYGMYVTDNSGRAKILVEYEGTARWKGRVHAATVRPLPLSAFRSIPPPRR
jgi:hypothetical protein